MCEVYFIHEILSISNNVNVEEQSRQLDRSTDSDNLSMIC